MAYEIGLIIFPDITQLDMTGPYEVFIKFPDAKVHLIWKTLDPITAGGGMQIIPTTTYADCPALDIICVPGGAGMNPLLTDEATLNFINEQARTAKYITSVCTGSLVLGAAGLLKGIHATTHWLSHDMLEAFGAIPTKQRVVRDGNIFTGGGVTAGIDFALTLAAEELGAEAAKKIQLGIEYNPEPPFNAGSPDSAGSMIVDPVVAASEKRQAERLQYVKNAAAKITTPRESIN